MIIGISGKAGSGKDTVAKYIKEYLESNGITTKRYSMADPLKQGCSKLFGVPLEHFYDRVLKEKKIDIWGKSPRELLIYVGTDLLRDQFDELIWVKRAKVEIDNIDCGVVVLPDIRFDNEVDFVEENGGVMLNVIRQVGNVTPSIAHKSENGVKQTKSTIIIDNNGTPETLQNKVNEIMGDIVIG